MKSEIKRETGKTMKYTFEIEINAPREMVAGLAGDPENRMKWMDGIESDEALSGTPGQPGAKSRLVFRTGNMKTTMMGTVIANNLPDTFSETFDAPNVFTVVTGKFVALSPQKTKYVSEQEFQFKGIFNKIVGFLLQKEFKNQTLRHVENFKRFAESEAVRA